MRPRPLHERQRALFQYIADKEAEKIATVLREGPICCLLTRLLAPDGNLVNMSYAECEQRFPLHYACVESNLSIVQLLLKFHAGAHCNAANLSLHFAEVERFHPVSRETALHVAVRAAIKNPNRVAIMVSYRYIHTHQASIHARRELLLRKWRG